MDSQKFLDRLELRMENHRGISYYSDTEIRISGGRSEIRVQGLELTLRAMNSRELLITGRILQLEFLGGADEMAEPHTDGAR